jgi:O-antigen/teichoic acid export membrane protein
MIRISSKDVIINYFATFLKLGGSIFLLPIILVFFTEKELGLYYTILNLISFSAIVDLGFNQAFLREFSMVYSKKKYIKSSTLINTSKFFFKYISLIISMIYLLFGSIYINKIADFEVNKIDLYFGWLLWVLGTSINTYFLYFEVIYIGTGNIFKYKKSFIFSQLTFFFSAFILFYLDYKFLAIGFSTFICAIVFRFMLYKSKSNIFQNMTLETLFSEKLITLKRLFKFTFKISIVNISSFIGTKGIFFIAPLFVGMELIGKYGFTKQIVVLLSSLSALYLTTYYPNLIDLKNHNKKKEFLSIIKKGFIFSLTFFLLGGICLLFFGNNLLNIISANNSLIDFKYVLLLLIGGFLELIHSNSCNILLIDNDVPFYKASFIISIFMVLLFFIFMNISDDFYLNIILTYLIGNLYHNFKWPLVLYNRHIK